MNRKQITSIIVVTLILASFGGVFLNRFGIPYLSSLPGLSWLNKITASNPVIINRTERVEFTDGVDLANLTKQIAGFTTNIYTGVNPNYKFAANGIIVSSDGLILTNKTNLPLSGTVTVVLNDGTNYQGTIRALDPKSEIAIITIPANNLTFAQFTDAAAVKANQRLVYLGRSNNEFVHKFEEAFINSDLSNSADINHVLSSENFEDTIQTDARINSDFVGGPVTNLEGKVVGMTNSNLSMLIGENLQTAVSTYLATGKIVRASLGIKYLNLSDSLAKLRSLPSGGALVVSIDAVSPAQAAGILPNDLIISIDSQSLPENSFEKILNSHSISDLAVTVVRNGKQINLTVKLQSK